MERKNEVMLAAALGAVAILIASSVVRCTLAGPQQQEEAPQESVPPPRSRRPSRRARRRNPTPSGSCARTRGRRRATREGP